MTPTARHTDPDTSHIAAARAAVTATNMRGRVLACLARHTRDPRERPGYRGLTDFELADHLDSPQTSCGVRRGELVKAGLVEDSGLRRPAPSGSPAIVWRITAAGLAKAADL